MRTAVLLLAVAAAAAARAATPGEVQVLDEETFDAAIAENPATLVEFFAPWCGHCKALAPEYEAAAKEINEQAPDAGVFASVDCTEHKDLCGRFEVRGFPTLKYFTKGSDKPTDYDQARKSDALVKFMIKQAQPAVTELASAADVAGFAAGESIRIVAFADAGADTTAFAAVANELRNEFSFALVAGDGSEFGVTSPGVAVLRDFDEGNVVYDGDFGSSDDLTTFIRAQSFPLIGTIGPDNYSKYLARGFPFVWCFVNLEDDATDAIVETLTGVAKSYRDSLSFVKLDGVKWAEHAKSFGLSGSTPGIVIEDRDRKKNYIYPEGDDVTSEAFSAFVAGYADGSLAPNVKSEPEPEDNSGPVTVIVGTTYESIVLDTTKDVLVEFYAPWCGHCKSLAPKYDELGEMFADDENVVIAKVDATANDVPADVSGFPTIIFYTAEDNTAVEYNGARTAEGMAEFIGENRKTAAPAGGAAKKAEGHDDL